MEDYTSNILNDSKNEWSILLINNITNHIIEGFRSIFNEALEICEKNDEVDKYLMTYQNLLSRIPSWNQTIIENEKNRIITNSKCSYLEDLITCVHILQLKLIACVNVSSEPKKIEINIPEISSFLHKVYINIARKLYSNIYLFELDIPPLEQQKRNREFELLVQTCIMNTIRDNLPIEDILRKYIDETQEIDVKKIESIVENKVELENKEQNNDLEDISANHISDTPNETIQVKQLNEHVSSSPAMPQEKTSSINQNNMIIPNQEQEPIQNQNELKLSWDPNVVDNENKTQNNEDIGDDDYKLNIGEEIKLDLDIIDENDNDNDIKLDIEEI